MRLMYDEVTRQHLYRNNISRYSLQRFSLSIHDSLIHDLLFYFDGSLGIFLIIQFIRGILLSIYYYPNVPLAFQSVIHIIQNGSFIHNIYINETKDIFYLHIHLYRTRDLLTFI